MNYLIISASDRRGGAAIACERLLEGLRLEGVRPRRLVGLRLGEDPDTHLFDEPAFAAPDWLGELRLGLRRSARSAENNALFSAPWPGHAIENHELVTWADVINLHWVTRQVTPESLHAMLLLGKPVIWTLHDQRAFTGGCHYSGNCENFVQECSRCPQLRAEFSGLAGKVHALSRACYGTAPLPVIVAPSRWLAQEAARSSLLGGCRIEVIPYGLDLEIFRPGDRARVREKYGIPEKATVLLLGAHSLTSKRKGFDLFLRAFQTAMEVPGVARRVSAGEVKLVIFGQGSQELATSGLPFVPLGTLAPGAEAAQAYIVSDLFVCPSREDNLPNTVLESIACGTPVLGSSVGGIPDMICDGETGWLVPKEDVVLFAKRIEQAILHPAELTAMGRAARLQAELKYSLARQAAAYKSLAGELLSQSEKPGTDGLKADAIAKATADYRIMAELTATVLKFERVRNRFSTWVDNQISRAEERKSKIDGEIYNSRHNPLRMLTREYQNRIKLRYQLEIRIRELEKIKGFVPPIEQFVDG